MSVMRTTTWAGLLARWRTTRRGSRTASDYLSLALGLFKKMLK